MRFKFAPFLFAFLFFPLVSFAQSGSVSCSATASWQGSSTGVIHITTVPAQVTAIATYSHCAGLSDPYIQVYTVDTAGAYQPTSITADGPAITQPEQQFSRTFTITEPGDYGISAAAHSDSFINTETGEEDSLPIKLTGAPPVTPSGDCAKLQAQYDKYGGGGVAALFPKYCTAASAVTRVLQIAFGLAGGIAVLFIILGGFRYMIASGGGNAEAAKQAKQTILYAVIGLVVILMATALVTIISNLIIKGSVF